MQESKRLGVGPSFEVEVRVRRDGNRVAVAYSELFDLGKDRLGHRLCVRACGPGVVHLSG